MSGAPTADRVPVLMYHRVDPDVGGSAGAAFAARAAGAYCVTPRQFGSHLAWLAEHGYRPCTVAAFDRWFNGDATLPPRSVLITFDDGFAGLHTHALPLLKARGWPATVFLVSALIGQRDYWTSLEFGSAGSHALLDRVQIDEMVRHGIEFHSHSRTHADLTQLADDELAAQVHGSRQDLQQLLGRAVDYFAYPFGRADARVRAAVELAGYRLAFSVSPGFNRAGAQALDLRRLDITAGDRQARFGRKVSLGSNDGSLHQQFRYLVRRAMARLSRPA